jgi:dGTPase
MSFEQRVFFDERFYPDLSSRGGCDKRSASSRDRARVLHSASFRRLQGKTQIMGTREGDFHRTRLTHSIECAQIAQGLREVLESLTISQELRDWFPERDLIEAACFSHDLGHPPFGHSGEKALHTCMKPYGIYGGFEGNAQTVRILTKLEKYQERGQGINPTRRFLLAVLKYPVFYSSFFKGDIPPSSPPKCVYEEDRSLLEWAFLPFSDNDKDDLFFKTEQKLERKFQTLDCSLMELADDIAYGIHDIEDMVARKLISRDIFREHIQEAFNFFDQRQFIFCEEIITADSLTNALFETSYTRKQIISKLVGFCITSTTLKEKQEFEHPLLRFCAYLPDGVRHLLDHLKKISMNLLIKTPAVAQLTRRGMRVVSQLFEVLMEDPKTLIPQTQGWPQDLSEDAIARRVCDYIAGMTDEYAQKIYGRLFLPGIGNTTDEL